MDNGFSSLTHPNGGAIPKTGGSKFYTTALSFEDNFDPATYINNQEQKDKLPSHQRSVQKSSSHVPTTSDTKKNLNTTHPKSADDISSHYHKQTGSPLICYAVRLKHGDELRKCLLSFVKKNSLKAAFIMTCVGSCTSARIRLASATPENEANYVSTKHSFDFYAKSGKDWVYCRCLANSKLSQLMKLFIFMKRYYIIYEKYLIDEYNNNNLFFFSDA